MRIGWFSTGRDEAARRLLEEALRAISQGFLPVQLVYCFVNRERGEDPETDKFLDLCEAHGLRLLSLSSRQFLPSLRKRDPEEWRRLYHWEVLRLVAPMDVDLGVLAGYMLIVSPEFSRAIPLVNLHPALPGGPTGPWEEVLWELIGQRAERTGAMIHLVTEELDRGPVVSFFEIPLRGKAFDPLWEAIGGKSYGEVRSSEEGERLFRLIRQEEERREVPLLLLTLKALAEGRVRIREGKVLPAPLDLSLEVEAFLGGRG